MLARRWLEVGLQSALCLLAYAAHIGEAAGVVSITPACAGDCNRNGAVTVDEILTMVNIALAPETVSITLCIPGDQNNDNKITVDEILTAVNNALNPPADCGRTATHTSTPPPSASPSPTRFFRASG